VGSENRRISPGDPCAGRIGTHSDRREHRKLHESDRREDGLSALIIGMHYGNQNVAVRFA